ncbi:glycosyltransferase [Candidatus Woesearchaeota archaeon]|nr:glycosyltransferase [Candidatus Woesearchaeota archaeon]
MLSIIIPTYNEGKYLGKLLDSIKMQNIKDYEIIIADNNSKDKTRDIARRFRCRIVKGGNKPGIGRNRGAKSAKGSLLLFLDADCCLEEGFIKGILDEFKKKKLGAAGCLLRPMSNRLEDKAYFKIFNGFVKVSEKVSPVLGGCCILVKKSIHNRIKGFDEELTMFEENDYIKRCLKHGRFGILNRKIDTSVRRFDTFGRIKVGSTIVMATAYQAIIGPIRKDVFRYRFDYKK